MPCDFQYSWKFLNIDTWIGILNLNWKFWCVHHIITNIKRYKAKWFCIYTQNLSIPKALIGGVICDLNKFFRIWHHVFLSEQLIWLDLGTSIHNMIPTTQVIDLSIICTFGSYHNINITKNIITYINMISVVPKQDGSIHIKYSLDF